jgi:succinate dehydrogenase / fumarate reductase cytochrome b subunit
MGVSSIGILTLYRSSIGKKVIMALTGLVWIGFVFAHMYGNLKVFQGAEYFNHYAEALRELGAPFFSYGQVLWIMRIVLMICLVAHMWAAWTLYQESQRARSTKYIKHQNLQANPAALYIRYGGVVIIVFILIHLMQFTLGLPIVQPSFDPNNPYYNLVVGFQAFYHIWAIFYIIAVTLLGFHLYHGAWSMFQTLGLNNQSYSGLLRVFALVLAVVITVGFAIVPLSVILGIVTV